jgi:hypothetical protein
MLDTSARAFEAMMGVIGALGVKSLSIDDNAVTVPAVQTLTSPENAGALRTVNTVTLSIDTTGLAGKTIAVLAGWTGSMGYSGTGANPAATMVINGSNVQTIAVTNSIDSFMCLTGSASFTASGGVDSITVSIGYSAASTGTPVLGQRTLWAMAAKR